MHQSVVNPASGKIAGRVESHGAPFVAAVFNGNPEPVSWHKTEKAAAQAAEKAGGSVVKCGGTADDEPGADALAIAVHALAAQAAADMEGDGGDDAIPEPDPALDEALAEAMAEPEGAIGTAAPGPEPEESAPAPTPPSKPKPKPAAKKAKPAKKPKAKAKPVKPVDRVYSGVTYTLTPVGDGFEVTADKDTTTVGHNGVTYQWGAIPNSFKSISAAAEAIVGRAQSGYVFWKVASPAEKTVSVLNLRLPPDARKALDAAAKKAGKRPGAYARDLIVAALG